MNISFVYRMLINDPCKWNYYDNRGIYNYDNIFPNNKCFDFIKDYLIKGEKGNIGCISLLRILDNDRLKHIVSAFFLGINMYHVCSIFKENIDKEISLIRECKQQETFEKRFYYLWMLICLFHDCGYAIENKEIQFRETEIKIIIKTLLKNMRPKSFPYRKKTIRSYHEFRLYSMGIIDHGILGGAFLYKELCDLRKQMEKNPHSDYYWGKELEQDFLHASWAIVCHNIYKITERAENANIYQFYELGELISNDKLININKHPILFLLCLVDSIEPIKLLKNPMYLESIHLDVKDNKVELDIKNLPNPNRTIYFNKIKELNSWLTDTKINKEQTVISIEI